MSLPPHAARKEDTGRVTSDLEWQADQSLAAARKVQRLESGFRRRQLERDKVKDRFSIILTPLEQHDDFAELAAKHLRIGTRLSALDRELRETITSIARGMSAFNKHKIEHQAQAIIDGVDAEAFQGFEEMKSRSVRLDSEVKSHARALGQVRAEMEAIRSERSIDAAEAVRPIHAKVVGVIADACATLQKALRDEALIREIVTDAGFDSRLPTFQGIKDIAELESRAREYAR